MCKSKIVEYLQEEGLKNPEDIVAAFAAKNIRVKFNNSLAIFNYNQGADFNDPIVQEARGIIIDLKRMRVVCWPFRKFGNWYESYADKIDWNSALIQEKVDGSLVKLYYYQGQWHWATNSCILASDAKVPGSNRTFQDVIESAFNYKDINYNKLFISLTYMFELVSPETRVVINYPIPKLYLIGMRENTTGKELSVYPEDMSFTLPNFLRPNVYAITDKSTAMLEKIKEMASELTDQEGFVVVDKDFNRVKVKSEEYIALHHAFSLNVLSADSAISLLLENDEEALKIVKMRPHLWVKLKYYDWQIEKIRLDARRTIIDARYEWQKAQDRKTFASVVKQWPHAFIAFKAIDHLDYDEDRLVRDYVNKAYIMKKVAPYPD